MRLPRLKTDVSIIVSDYMADLTPWSVPPSIPLFSCSLKPGLAFEEIFEVMLSNFYVTAVQQFSHMVFVEFSWHCSNIDTVFINSIEKFKLQKGLDSRIL